MSTMRSPAAEVSIISPAARSSRPATRTNSASSAKLLDGSRLADHGPLLDVPGRRSDRVTQTLANHHGIGVEEQAQHHHLVRQVVDDLPEHVVPLGSRN